MDPNTMALRIRFFLLALGALTLSLSFPAWPVSWLVLTQAAAYQRFSFRSSLLVSIFLGVVYAGFSSAPIFLWVLPGLLGLSLFHYGKRHFTFHPMVEHVGLWILLWAADAGIMEVGGFWLWGRGFFSWSSLSVLVGTLVTGMFLLPLLQWVLLEFWRRLPKPRNKVREVQWLNPREKDRWHQGEPRKPFGFERTL